VGRLRAAVAAWLKPLESLESVLRAIAPLLQRFPHEVVPMQSEQVQRHDDRLELNGELRLADGPQLWDHLDPLSREVREGRLDVDLTRAKAIDGAVMALLVELRTRLNARGVRCELVADDPGIRQMIHLYGGDRPLRPSTAPPRRGPTEALLAATSRFGAALAAPVAFFGELVEALGLMLRQPAQVNWRDLPEQVTRAGADGVPIVLLLNFLVGFVTAFQSVNVLRTYGANAYVADLVGVSVTRELAPLLTAIIVGGRSGASFAAELGAMRVSEEIDALKTMGFSPTAFLVYPRVLALALVAPGLTLIGDLMGLTGGGMVAVSSLGLSFTGFVTRLHDVLGWRDLVSGMIKSVAFGAMIGFVGCQQGFSTRGAAVGVGRSTTATVVLCLFQIVVLDTVFTVLFRALHL
jgi:phospholipid/cholesterol/gamma-HCH transport system permease protein